jgi:hypothetical protein
VLEDLKRDYQLAVLGISLRYTGARASVVFGLSSGGETLGLLEATAAEIGLAGAGRTTTPDPDPESRFSLPDHVLTGLVAQFGSRLAPGEPLWLELVPPRGLLPLVPWERLLVPRLNVPVLRLPRLRLRPVIPRETLDAVVCFSAPPASLLPRADLVDRLIHHIPQDFSRRTTFHLFGDQPALPLLKQIQTNYGDKYQVHLYDPTEAPPSGPPPAQGTDQPVDSPWLLWIEHALAGRSVDLVHFVCHGYLTREQGALALTESPWQGPDEGTARMVFTGQLSAFLNQVGAWAVFLSSPARPTSAGLRMLQEELAQLRPGPILFHDTTDPQAGPAIEAVYRFLFGTGPQPVPHTPAASLCCHPFRGQDQQAPDAWGNELLDRYTLSAQLGEELRGPDNTPAWLAGAQRRLEQSAANLLTENNEAVERGRQEALRFVADVMARHARKAGQPPEKP